MFAYTISNYVDEEKTIERATRHTYLVAANRLLKQS